MNNSNSSNWLLSLERYKCPTCNNETIFKSGCNDCETLANAKQDFIDLNKEYTANQLELKALHRRQAEIAIELVKVDLILNKGV